MTLALAAGLAVALLALFACLISFDRGYAAAALKYETTYRDAIDRYRAEQSRARGQQVLEELRGRVRRQADERRAGRVDW